MVEACDEGGTWAREQLLLRQTLAGRRFRWCWRGEGAEAWTSACQGRPLAWGTLHSKTPSTQRTILGTCIQHTTRCCNVLSNAAPANAHHVSFFPSSACGGPPFTQRRR